MREGVTVVCTKWWNKAAKYVIVQVCTWESDDHVNYDDYKERVTLLNDGICIVSHCCVSIMGYKFAYNTVWMQVRVCGCSFYLAWNMQ